MVSFLHLVVKPSARVSQPIGGGDTSQIGQAWQKPWWMTSPFRAHLSLCSRRWPVSRHSLTLVDNGRVSDSTLVSPRYSGHRPFAFRLKQTAFWPLLWE